MIVAMLLPAAAYAFDVKSGSNVYIGADEIINGNLYAGASSILIDGRVTGDIFCGASSVTINGTVDGDVFCGASSLVINGTVGGSVRSATSELSINGRVERSVLAGSSNISVGPDATIGWSVTGAAATMTVSGSVGGDILFAGANLMINNSVGGEVAFYSDNKSDKPSKNGPGIEILPNTNITGDLSYPENITANISETAVIGGKVSKLAAHQKNKGNLIAAGFGSYLFFKLIFILSMLVIGLVLVSLFSKKTLGITNVMIKEPGASIGWGALTFFVVPVIAIFLAFTFIGIPLAFLLAVSYLLMLCFAKLMAAIAVGRYLMKKMDNKSLYWAMIAGIVISYIIFAIPLFGWLLGVVALWWSLGGIVKYCNAERK